MPHLFACLAALAALLPAVAPAQYKWIDATGRVNYGDNPPREAQKVEKLRAAPSDGVNPVLNLPFELRRAVENFPVQLYVTGDCAPCQTARELLRARGVPYQELTVSTREDAELMRTRGLGDLLPVLTIGRSVLRQFAPDPWHRALDAAGYPRSAMLPASWRNPAPRPAADAAAATAARSTAQDN